MAYKNREDERAYKRKYNKEYYKKNPIDPVAKARYDKDYRVINKEKKREQQRIWYLANKEHCAAKSKKHAEDNKEKIADWYKNIWLKSESGRFSSRTAQATRRARVKQAKGSFTKLDINDLFASQGGKCYYCREESDVLQIEHMIPLSRGGRNDVSNICLACAPCNMKKHTKTATEFKETFKGETNEEAIDCN